MVVPKGRVPVAKLPMKCLQASSRCDGLRCTGSRRPASLTQLPWPAVGNRTVRGALGWQRGGAPDTLPTCSQQAPPNAPQRGHAPSEGTQGCDTRTPCPHARPSGSPLQTTTQHTPRSHRPGLSETLKAVAAH